MRISPEIHYRARVAAAMTARTLASLTEGALLLEIARVERLARPDPRP